MPDVDIREGYDAIDFAIRQADAGTSYEIWNSDEDLDDSPAPRCVMISKTRYEELLETEFMFNDRGSF